MSRTNRINTEASAQNLISGKVETNRFIKFDDETELENS